MRARLTIVLAALSSAHALADTAYPRLEYRPGLAEYVPYREVELADWREANETVKRLGGHMGHTLRPDGRPDRTGRETMVESAVEEKRP